MRRSRCARDGYQSLRRHAALHFALVIRMEPAICCGDTCCHSSFATCAGVRVKISKQEKIFDVCALLTIDFGVYPRSMWLQYKCVKPKIVISLNIATDVERGCPLKTDRAWLFGRALQQRTGILAPSSSAVSVSIFPRGAKKDRRAIGAISFH